MLTLSLFVCRDQRLLKRPDTVAAIGHQLSGADPASAWSSSTPVSQQELDSLFARLPDYHELTLPLRHNYKAAEQRAAIEAEWEQKYAEYLESGEAPGYFGTLMRQRYHWA